MLLQWLSCKELPACNAGDQALIPGLGRFLEEGMATHSSVLTWRIPMDRGAWGTLHAVAESQTEVSDYAHHIAYLNGLFKSEFVISSS